VWVRERIRGLSKGRVSFKKRKGKRVKEKKKKVEG